MRKLKARKTGFRSDLRRILVALCVLAGSVQGHFGGVLHADETGSVTGRVTYAGQLPRPRKLVVNKDQEVCGHEPREFRRVDVSEEGGLKDVVVFLELGDYAGDWTHPEEGYTLKQEGCRFEPYILLFSKDRAARLTIVNSDPTLHNVRIAQILGRVKSTLVNVSQPKGTPPKVRALRLKPGSPVVEVTCDAHSFMQGWIFAADNPHCVRAGDDGSFVLEGLPPGAHRIGVWHPYLGFQYGDVTIDADAATPLEFDYSIEDMKR